MRFRSQLQKQTVCVSAGCEQQAGGFANLSTFGTPPASTVCGNGFQSIAKRLDGPLRNKQSGSGRSG
jgi:hypothetical protein